jgi:hypothetical protein
MLMLLTAGCGGQIQGHTHPPIPAAICAGVFVPAVQLAFPQNGATVAASNLTVAVVYVSDNDSLDPYGFIVQFVADGTALNGGGPAAPPSPLPSPLAPAPAWPSYSTVGFSAPSLRARQTYTIRLQSNKLACGGYPLDVPLGSVIVQ